MHATIDKYLRELKYLQISSNFIKATAEFWINFWGKFNDEAPTLVCYYIDGNTKPLWSSMSCKKSKVSMHGRVMGCLEQVFIHDSFGRPTYFQTFSGNANIGDKALSLWAQTTHLSGIRENSHQNTTNMKMSVKQSSIR